MALIKKEEFNDEGWMQAVNVSEKSTIQDKLKHAIDEVIGDVLKDVLGVSEDKVQIYNKTFCPDVWSPDKKLNPEVRDALLKIAFDFFKDTELKADMKDVLLLGSIANYNWTSQSDMDTHILVDVAQLQMHPENAEKFLRSLVGKWNLEHEIKIKGHKVELYLQDVREENAAMGVYSLLQDAWIKEPSPENIQVDKKLIQTKYSMWVEKINDAIRREDEKALKKILASLKDYRQSGLDKQGEFSAENLTFKILRARGYIGKLKTAFNNIYDKKMTVKDGFDPLSQGPNMVDPTVDNTGAYYSTQNRRMRQLEVVKKDLKSTLPSMSFDWSQLPFDKLTLDNLKSLQSKLERLHKAHVKKPEITPESSNEMRQLLNVYHAIEQEMKKRLAYINKSVSEGYGAGIPETDRLKIYNDDGSVQHWRIRSKDAPKTPKLPASMQELVNEVLDNLLMESPKQETLKKNKRPLTPTERKQVMKAGAVWHHGPKGEETPAVWKAVVNGKTWYCCNTHRAIQIKPTLKGAIKAFEFIKSTA